MQASNKLTKCCLTVLCVVVMLTSCRTSSTLVQQTSTAVTTNQLPWNGKQASIVLTYDDALNVHLDNAIPLLDTLGFKGTFYLSDYYGKMQSQLPRWKVAASNGHELGNHSVYHPCEGGRPGREFVRPQNDLNNYTVQRMTNEITTMNSFLQQLDSKTNRTFAFPCSDTRIHDTAYIEFSKQQLVAARAVRAEMPLLENVRVFDVPAYAINGESGEKLVELVQQAIAKKALLVFLFHGVGGEHSLNVSLEAHAQLLRFIKQHEKELWVAPMVEVAAYVKNNQTFTR